MTQKPKGKISHLEGFLSGAVAGAVAKTAVYPLDRVKMIYQVKGNIKGTFKFSCILKELKSILHNEGFVGLWKGNASSFGRTFPHAGIVFMCFDVYQDCILRLWPDSSPYIARLAAGGCAGMTSAIITYPLDLWNTRMAVSGRMVSHYSQVTLMSVEGWKAPYRGLTPTILGIFPYAALSFCTYESLKFECQNLTSEEHLAPSVTMACGAAAGLISQTCTYPLDTIRKRMQSHSFLLSSHDSCGLGPQPLGIWQTAKSIWTANGIRGFFNGLGLNWIKGPFSVGLSFMLHELLKRRW
eukprot:Platyproteum_vivax@DN3497_c0_g1_i1.p1